MKAFMSIALFAAAVSAQSSTASAAAGTSSCAAQSILEACLSTTTGYVNQCSQTDYGCLCDRYTAINTCFNNCPQDSRAPSYAQQQQSYCVNASLYSSASSTASSTGTKTASGITATCCASTTASASTDSSDSGSDSSSGGSNDSGSSTSSASGSTETNGAAVLAGGSGYLFAAVGALAALL